MKLPKAGRRKEAVGYLFNGRRFSFWEDKVLELDSGCGCTTLNVLNATEPHPQKLLTYAFGVVYLLQ